MLKGLCVNWASIDVVVDLGLENYDPFFVVSNSDYSISNPINWLVGVNL